MRSAAVSKVAEISIHALREESDARRPVCEPWHGYFNPRSP